LFYGTGSDEKISRKELNCATKIEIMKLIKTTAFFMMVLTVAACSVFRKSKTPPPPAAPPADANGAAIAPATPAVPLVTHKPANGVFAPGNEELTAIQAKYKDATMATLNHGYRLYTTTCTKCHEVKNIYTRAEAKWPAIIDKMAQKAGISSADKDAVYKYVMSVKATQPR
jgi:mono/diheme cytochrome c family protein